MVLNIGNVLKTSCMLQNYFLMDSMNTVMSLQNSSYFVNFKKNGQVTYVSQIVTVLRICRETVPLKAICMRVPGLSEYRSDSETRSWVRKTRWDYTDPVSASIIDIWLEIYLH